jgi:hypothetical protein
MKKVQAYGFTENIEEWLSDFLIGRSQVVNIKGEHSEAKNIKSGIPQGSVLGPFLFVLFVNDLPEIVRSMLFLFADDSKISRAISENNDKIILQNDLDAIVKWSDTWLMRIHPDKSAHVRIGKQMEVPQYEYMVGVRHVNYSTQEKDLGVVIDYELKFDAHIHEKVKKANMMAGWVRRSFLYIDKYVFNMLYKSLVRSHLEHAAPVWNPHLARNIDKIEEVQIRATKMVPGLRSMTYPDRLKHLQLPTLVYRRIRGDMINVFKIMTGKYHAECCPKLTTTKEKTGFQGKHSKYLYQDRSRLDVRKFSFTQRVSSIWNTLPEDVVSAENVDIFKGRLDEHWEEEPVKYDYKAPLSHVRITRM